MTEEKAIDKCNELIKSKNANWIGLYNQNAIETVLNMLKEKDKDINRKNSTIKALQCALHERTEERDRKDYIIARQKKQIDLMADSFAEDGFYNEHCQTLIDNELCPDDCNKCIKQYFKSKVEKTSGNMSR